MDYGTWLWYDWSAFFILIVAVVFAATTSHALILKTGHRVWAALSLIVWIYAGTLALMVFSLGEYYVE